MNPDADTSDLFPEFSPVPQMVFVNDRVSFQTEGNQRVILVHGVVHSHYSREDRLAEAYALVSLYESGYADQNDLARSFGYSTRTLRRFQQRLHSGGLNALVRPEERPVGASTGPQTTRWRASPRNSRLPGSCRRPPSIRPPPSSSPSLGAAAAANPPSPARNSPAPPARNCLVRPVLRSSLLRRRHRRAAALGGVARSPARSRRETPPRRPRPFSSATRG